MTKAFFCFILALMTNADKTILVLGAGRSSSSLIQYLIQEAEKNNWKVRIGDASLNHAQQKAGSSTYAEAVFFDVNNEQLRKEEIKNSDLVISLMPPPFHYLVAQTCLEFSKHLLTASYVSPEIESLHLAAVEKNILILMETGLDPGIDHMSAMKELEHIQKSGGKLISFKSFTGGLVAPESDNNPWNYKITWNPRNVVLAGQGVSKYLENGKLKELDYKELFTQLEKVSVKGFGDFEGYANRDSLKYLDTYQLKDLDTFLRGTLRRPGFAGAWNVLVQIGFTDSSQIIQDSENLSYRQITEFLLHTGSADLEKKLKSLGSSETIEKIKWLDLLSERKTGISNASPADVLQKLLESKLRLEEGDKDMIVMQHQFEYVHNEKKKKLISSLVVKGEDEIFTAMAKTVGLPLGVAAKLLLENKITLRGVQIPVHKEIYEPVLKELEDMGIEFFNEEIDL